MSKKSEWNKKVVQSFLAGSFSGVCSTILFQPLDLIKTRLQSPQQRETFRLTRLTAVIVKQKNVFGLWRGLTPSLLRCVPGMGIYFGTLNALTITCLDDADDVNAFQSVVFGAVARSISVGSLLPLTVLKTRFESEHYQYKSLFGATWHIYTTEGIRGLYCGLAATIFRDVPYSGLYLMFYTSSKRKLLRDWENDTTSTKLSLLHFCCGVMSGILASLITHPADVVKTRMQLFPDRFGNIPAVMQHIYMVDGFQGYFRGLLPRLIKRTLVTAMTWTIYERIMKKLGIK